MNLITDSPTLIIIDDDPNLLFSLKELFRREQFTVFTARNGTEALRRILSDQPDLIVCDVMMPPPNGFEVQRILKNNVSTMDIPFIFLSASGARKDILNGLQNGADDYLIKPFDPDVLLAKVNTLILRSRKAKYAAAEANASNRLGNPGDQLRTIQQISNSIHTGFDMGSTLQRILMEVVVHLNAQAVDLWWVNEVSRQQEFSVGISALRPIWVENETGEPSQIQFSHRSYQDETLRDYWQVPITVSGEHKGVLRVFATDLAESRMRKTNFIDTLIDYISIIMDKDQTLRQLDIISRDNDDHIITMMEGLGKALDLRDHNTGDHSARVTQLSVALAKKLGVGVRQLRDIRIGAMAHDIGKIGVPDYILSKPGSLDEAEWQIMRQHPLFALEMLSRFDFLERALDIPLYHHERWDGKGYPFGLSGNQIPLAAQIFSIVDMWDAVTNDRPYRKAMTREEALGLVNAGNGSFFAPDIVRAFLELLDEME